MVPVGSMGACRIFLADPAAIVQRNLMLARLSLGVSGVPVVTAFIVGDGNKVLITQVTFVVTSTLTLRKAFGNPVGKLTNANVVGFLVLVLVVVELIDDTHAHDGGEKAEPAALSRPAFFQGEEALALTIVLVDER